MDLVTLALCRKLISDGISTLGSVFTMKGNVSSFAELPSTGNKSGDFYLVGPYADGSYDEYYWIDSGKWEHMGSTKTDLSSYITQESLYLGEDGTGSVEQPAQGTILNIVNSQNRLNFLSMDNVVEYTPTTDYNPATKKYVDDYIAQLEAKVKDLEDEGELEII